MQSYNRSMSEQQAPLPESELKKCPYCGHMTSIHANFCYYCARELVARPERPSEDEKPRPVNWVVVVAIMVLLLVVVLAITVK